MNGDRAGRFAERRRAQAMATAVEHTAQIIYDARRQGWDALSDPPREVNGAIVLRVSMAHWCDHLCWHVVRSLPEWRWIQAGHRCSVTRDIEAEVVESHGQPE